VTFEFGLHMPVKFYRYPVWFAGVTGEQLIKGKCI